MKCHPATTDCTCITWPTKSSRFSRACCFQIKAKCIDHKVWDRHEPSPISNTSPPKAHHELQYLQALDPCGSHYQREQMHQNQATTSLSITWHRRRIQDALKNLKFDDTESSSHSSPVLFSAIFWPEFPGSTIKPITPNHMRIQRFRYPKQCSVSACLTPFRPIPGPWILTSLPHPSQVWTNHPQWTPTHKM